MLDLNVKYNLFFTNGEAKMTYGKRLFNNKKRFITLGKEILLFYIKTSLKLVFY